MKFFNIVKANTEIEKLEAQVTALTGEVATLKENAPQIEAAAETLRTEKTELSSKLAQAESDLAAAKQTISTLTNEKADVARQLAEANAKLANPEQRIQELAANKALEISGSAGVPLSALPSCKNETGAETLEGVREQMKTETDPVKKSALAKKARELRGHGDMFKS